LEFPTSIISEDPTEVEETGIPKLFIKCVRCIVANIKMFEDLSFIQDGFLLASILEELKHQKKLNNANIKLFLVKGMDRLCLGSETYISDGTLKRIGIQCPELRHLKLVGCISLTDNVTQSLCKKCTKLVSVHFEDCKYFGDASLKHLGTFCKNICSVRLQKIPLITIDGMKKFLSLATTLQSLVIIECEIDSNYFAEIQMKYPNLKLFSLCKSKDLVIEDKPL